MLQHLICFVHAGPTLCSSQEILLPLCRRQYSQVCSFPTHPTLSYSARAPRPCLPLLLPASLPSPARLHNVCAPRATPRKPALARSPLPHASTRRIVPLVRWRCLYRRLYGACDGNPWPRPAAAGGRRRRLSPPACQHPAHRAAREMAMSVSTPVRRL